MNNGTVDPTRIAALLVALAGAEVKPDAVEESYRAAADDMRKVAGRAAASRTGKARGYTAEDATRLAKQSDWLASAVPAAIRHLLARRHGL